MQGKSGRNNYVNMSLHVKLDFVSVLGSVRTHLTQLVYIPFLWSVLHPQHSHKLHTSGSETLFSAPHERWMFLPLIPKTTPDLCPELPS